MYFYNRRIKALNCELKTGKGFCLLRKFLFYEGDDFFYGFMIGLNGIMGAFSVEGFPFVVQGTKFLFHWFILEEGTILVIDPSD